MTALTDAYERLQQHVKSLPPSVRDPLMVVLDARCGTCKWWDEPYGDCGKWGTSFYADHGCRAWEKREETA